MTQPPRREPSVRDPAHRTRLAWTRTAIAFVAVGAAMLKRSPLAGGLVLALSVPVWAAVRGTLLPSRSPRGLLLVTVIVVVVALVALVSSLVGPSPASLGQLLHGR
jgi:uncharacterized membrane protein YidH (DUF202 family)